MGKKNNQQAAKKRADKRNKRVGHKANTSSVTMGNYYKGLDLPEGQSASRALALLSGAALTHGRTVVGRNFINKVLAHRTAEGERQMIDTDYTMPLEDIPYPSKKSAIATNIAADIIANGGNVVYIDEGSKSDFIAQAIAATVEAGQTVVYIDDSTPMNQSALDGITSFNAAMKGLAIEDVTVTASLGSPADIEFSEKDYEIPGHPFFNMSRQDYETQLLVDIDNHIERDINEGLYDMSDSLHRAIEQDVREMLDEPMTLDLEDIDDLFGEELDRIGLEIDSDDDDFSFEALENDEFEDWPNDNFEDDIDLYYNESNMGIWTGDGPIPTNGLEGTEIPSQHYSDLDDRFFDERFDDSDWD